MSDATTIWRLGRWLAAHGSGTVHLGWGAGHAALHVAHGQLIGLEGMDPECVANAIGRAPAGQTELFAEARALAERDGIPETRALAGVKRCLEHGLEAWLLDPKRTVRTEDEPQAEAEGAAISIAHVLVELLLSGDEPALAEHVLPREDVLLRRGPRFLERYPRLQLSEEADLVAAKITGTRTAGELLERSPHPRDEVLRLLAALTASGLLEPVPVATPDPGEVSFPPEEAPSSGSTPHIRHLQWRWVAAAAVVLLLILVAMGLALRHKAPAAHSGTQTWGVVVDMGCEAVDYERMLRKVRKHPKHLTAVKTGGDGSGPCWRLIWGSFPSQETAREGLEKIPKDAIADGFSPHAIELSKAFAGEEEKRP